MQPQPQQVRANPCRLATVDWSLPNTSNSNPCCVLHSSALFPGMSHVLGVGGRGRHGEIGGVGGGLLCFSFSFTAWNTCLENRLQ